MSKTMIILELSEDQLKSIISLAIQEALTNSPSPAISASHSPLTAVADNGHIKGIKGLSVFLKVSHSRAQAIKNSGILPYFQTGKLILFDPVKVREAMENYANRLRRAK